MLGIDGIYPSRVEKISLSFAALTRSISFSTLEINFIYFFAVRYPCFKLLRLRSGFSRYGRSTGTAADFKLKVNKNIILFTV